MKQHFPTAVLIAALWFKDAIGQWFVNALDFCLAAACWLLIVLCAIYAGLPESKRGRPLQPNQSRASKYVGRALSAAFVLSLAAQGSFWLASGYLLIVVFVLAFEGLPSDRKP